MEIKGIHVKPCHTLVLLTTDEALVLLPDGNWTRTPLKPPVSSLLPSLYKPRTNIPQYVQQFGRLADAQKDFGDELERYCQQNPPENFQSENPAFSASLDRGLKSIGITRSCKLSKTSATSFYRWTGNGWANGKFWDDLPQDLLDWIELVALSFKTNPDTTAAPAYRWHRKGGEGC